MIYHTIQRHAEHTPDAVALRHDGALTTYAELARQARAAAAMLLAQGIGHGDRVGFLGQNHPSQLVLLIACAGIGAAQVPLNWRLAVPELRYILGNSEAVALFATPEFLVPARRAAPRGCAVLDATAAWPDAAPPALAAEMEDPLLLVYTSGTTGQPKGVPLDQRAMVVNAINSQHMHALTAADRVLTVLPLFHVGGLNIQTMPALLNGAEVILHQRFDPGAFLADCASLRPSLSLLVPAVMQSLVQHPGWPTAELSSLRSVSAGSSELPLPLIEAFHARGIPVQQVYGATETSPIAVYQLREEALANPGALGFQALHGGARIVDATGRPAPPDTSGEIEVRGPQVARGYWNAPDATAAAFRDGWFATGDIGRRDAAGRFRFTDRLKHLIISGGENIYPAEVEQLLRTAPGVLEGAVCGRPDARWGEVPVAVVVAGPGFDPAAVLAHFEGRLARFKHPQAVVAVPELPRTALGKIRLDALRALAMGAANQA